MHDTADIELTYTVDDDDHEVDLQQLLRSLPTRGGVTKDDLKELMIWLGPQAHSLRGGIRLIEYFAGHTANLSREARQRGHGVISLGHAHGQHLGTRRGRRMSIMLVKYTTPVDVWVAWECKYWSQWAYVNEADPDQQSPSDAEGLNR